MIINCAICNNKIDESKNIRSFKYMLNRQEYKLYRCDGCGLDFWSPMEFYAKFYEEELPEHEILSMGYREAPPQAALFFKRFPKGFGRLLDVGCNEGAFLEAAGKVGFDVYGIDLDTKGIKAAREIRKLKNVFVKYLSEFAKDKSIIMNGFEVISFFEVLEHQTDPKSFISDIKACLKSGGIIAGSVPNRERIFPNLHKASVLGDYPPAHFTRWSKANLKYFLAQEGFSDIEISTFGLKNLGEIVHWLSANMLDGGVELVKKVLIKEKKHAALNYSQLKQVENPIKVGIMNTLKALAGLFFLPLAIVIYSGCKKNGHSLFFVAKYRG